MLFLLSLKGFIMIFKGKKTTHHVKEPSVRVEIRWTCSPRFPVHGRFVSTAIISYPCSVLLTACSEARGHHTTVPIGSPRDPPDPTSAGCSLPSRSTGVAPSQTPANSSSPFQCLYASIPSPSPQFTEWSRLSFTGKHWRPFHTTWQNFPLCQFIMPVYLPPFLKEYPFFFFFFFFSV